MDNSHNYIRRGGRMTKAQSRGYDADLANYLTTPDAWLSKPGPHGIEIGFGMGQGLIEWALAANDWQLLGIELYKPGVGAVSDRLKQLQLEHVGIVEQPAQLVFAALPDLCIDEVRILFPDPWPNKRHAKRRLVQPECIADLTRTLKVGGCLKLATDWAPYAEWMREVVQAESRLSLDFDQVRAASDTNLAHTDRDERTKFEARGQRLGHQVVDLKLTRKG